MKNTDRICAFYRHGPHYIRMLKYLRQRWPSSWITAMTPPVYPQDVLKDLADDILVMDRNTYKFRNFVTLLTLIRRIRAEKFDHFVVMFDTPKLRLLAVATRIPDRFCYSVDGRYFPLKFRLIPLIADTLYRNIRGRFTYAYIHYIVHHNNVDEPK